MPASNVKIKATYKDRYTILEGANQTYTIGSNTDVVIKASGDASDLEEIQVNGNVLNSNDYKIETGSTVLTLFSKYLNTLKAGDYTVEFLYKDGKTKTALKVVNKNNNNNNNNNNQNNNNQNNNNQNNNQEDNKGINNKDKKDNQKQEDTDNPQTGDNISNYIWILLISLTGLVSGIVYLSKDKLKILLAK